MVADIANPTPARRGLKKTEAAAYCGVSTDKFDKLVRAAKLPRPLPWGNPKTWDRHALDVAMDKETEFALTGKRHA